MGQGILELHVVVIENRLPLIVKHDPFEEQLENDSILLNFFYTHVLQFLDLIASFLYLSLRKLDAFKVYHRLGASRPLLDFLQGAQQRTPG